MLIWDVTLNQLQLWKLICTKSGQLTSKVLQSFSLLFCVSSSQFMPNFTWYDECHSRYKKVNCVFIGKHRKHQHYVANNVYKIRNKQGWRGTRYGIWKIKNLKNYIKIGCKLLLAINLTLSLCTIEFSMVCTNEFWNLCTAYKYE